MKGACRLQKIDEDRVERNAKRMEQYMGKNAILETWRTAEHVLTDPDYVRDLSHRVSVLSSRIRTGLYDNGTTLQP